MSGKKNKVFKKSRQAGRQWPLAAAARYYYALYIDACSRLGGARQVEPQNRVPVQW